MPVPSLWALLARGRGAVFSASTEAEGFYKAQSSRKVWKGRP